MVNGLLQDIINDAVNRIMARHDNEKYRSRYKVEKINGVCVVTDENCQLFESVGKYLAKSDVVGSITIDSTGIIDIDGKKPDADRLYQCIGNGEEYLKLCETICKESS